MSALLAFSAQHVCQLTGLSMRQVRYWDRTGFFSPCYSDEHRRRPFSRVYSFRDVVGLRAIAVLRQQYRVPLQELRRVGAQLAERYESPWTSLRLYVAGQRVFFDDPTTGARVATNPPAQAVFPIEMQRIAHEMQAAVKRLRKRQAEDIGKVTQHRYVAHNAPVLAGTRIPTSAVWNFHQAGYDTAAIIREYPRLTPDDVRAAITYEEQRRQKRAG
jgi:uncharacterized protein (DUF433 family)